MKIGLGQFSRPLVLSGLLAGVAVVVLAAGMTAATARSPGSGEATGDAVTGESRHESGGTAPRRVGKCLECGVIESVRAIDARNDESGVRAAAKSADLSPPASSTMYEVIVRLKDGESRRFVDSHPAKWRSGERVIVIDGSRRYLGDALATGPASE